MAYASLKCQRVNVQDGYSPDSGLPVRAKRGSSSAIAKIEDATKRMQGWPITFKDDNKATLDSFRAFLAQERAKGDVGLAVIDYLQLLSAPGFDSRVQEVSHL